VPGAAVFSHETQRGLDAEEKEDLLVVAGRKKLLVVT